MNRLRPSHVEREAVHDLLSQGFADGRIEFDEFEARVELVSQATTISELIDLTEGLPARSLTFAEQTPPPDLTHRPPSWTRRGVLAAAGLVAGFAVSGGLERAFAHLRPTPSPEAPGAPEPAPGPDEVDQFAPGQFEASLQTMADAGYTTFTRIHVNPNLVSAIALAPGRTDVTDDLSIIHGKFSSEPNTEVGDHDFPFTLEEFDATLLPAYLATAPELLGGERVSHLIVGSDEGRVHVNVYVEGDEYGTGGGYISWSGDGQQLLRIAR